MDVSDAASTGETSLPSLGVIQRNDDIIRNLHVEDLNFIEKDLDFSDKVSLLFLLYGTNRHHARYALQRLSNCFNQIESVNRQSFSSTTELSNWVHEAKNKNWQWLLVEALFIIKAKFILRKMGLNIIDLHIRFPPHIHFRINPVLKYLYNICEDLNPNEAREMIEFIDGSHIRTNPSFYNYLELSILHWISDCIIIVDDFDLDENSKSICNVDKVINFLKMTERDLLKEQLECVVKSININITINKQIKIEKCEDYGANHGDNVDDEEKCYNQTTASGVSPIDGSIMTVIDRYIITKENAGMCLIISQKNFEEIKDKKKFDTRYGTERDEAALLQIFQSFGYKIHLVRDLSMKSMLLEIKTIANNSKNSDSLVVCILSHGNKGVIYDEKCNPVKIDKIKKEIAIPCLSGKPKILIIQACQDSVKQSPKNLVSDGADDTPLPHCDMITLYSTISGFKSYRHTIDGTWFIQTLCKYLDEFGDNEHLQKIYLRVSNYICDKRGDMNEIMVPYNDSTLRRELYFPRRK